MTPTEAFPFARQIQEHAHLDLERRQDILREILPLTLSQAKELTAIIKKWGFDFDRFRRTIARYAGITSMDPGFNVECVGMEYCYRCAEIWENGLGWKPLDIELRAGLLTLP